MRCSWKMCIRDRAQGGAVDAVAHAVGGLRVAGEHVAQVRIPGQTSDLGAVHPMAVVWELHHSGLLDGLGKGGPAAAALKLVRRGEQGLAGDHIHIDTLFESIPEFVGKGALRAALLGDVILLGGQFVPNGFRRRLLICLLYTSSCV